MAGQQAAVTGAAQPPGIRVEGLTLRYGSHTIFEDLSFTIGGGQFVALLGASGVGKSSLLKIIAGLSKPAQAMLRAPTERPLWGGWPIWGQQDLLLPWLTVVQNVTLGARLRGEKPDLAWAEHLLARVGLAHRRDALPGALSGGMRQRCAIARTLYERQPYVLMDEPFSALDAINRAMVQDLAAELLTDRTVLLITHDPMEACRLGHHLLVLSGHPASMSAPIVVSGTPPRAPDNADVIRAQADLLRQFVRHEAEEEERSQ